KWTQNQLTLAEKVVTCYEDGHTGFWLHRQMNALGVSNYVVCPSCLDSRKKGVNTDQTDANELESRLDRYLAGNQKVFSVITVPTLEQEQRRAITRQREQLCKHRLSLAAQGRTLMLLHGIRQSNQWWKASRWAKLAEQLPSWLMERLTIFRTLIEAVEKQLKALLSTITQEAPTAKPVGMGELTHEVIEREGGDW